MLGFLLFTIHIKKKKRKKNIIVNNFKPLTELGGVSCKCTGGCKVCMYNTYLYISTYIGMYIHMRFQKKKKNKKKIFFFMV